MEKMDVVFLLDRSGSMQGIEEDTIGGYNSYIKEQKKNDINVTTVLFDNNYEMLTERVDIKKIKKLTSKDYFVRGSTALLDAIGKTIAYMDSKKAKKVLFIITTDGMENASREYTKDKIKNMIKKHKNWEFMYIGADIDSYSEGSSIGISVNNIANYKKDKKGVKTLFKSVAMASECYSENARLSSDWKDNLDDYINKNKE